MTPSSDPKREFAEHIVRRLRGVGHVALWAGGCVRDHLLGRTPKDYDVATDATPEEVCALFGPRRTLLIGAAFGVAAVRGPRDAGQVEVTTFRTDGTYSDGRHPDAVQYSSAREDALRRDFTVNGMFFDPVAQTVMDYVGGQEDLARGLIRAIGSPEQRFAEDKLRMLRAIRFAASLEFAVEPGTHAAIRRMAAAITVVSPERIAMEMRRILTERGRVRGVELLHATGLGIVVFPEIFPNGEEPQRIAESNRAVHEALPSPSFPLAMAALLAGLIEPDQVAAIGQRWRLATRETERIAWLLQHPDGLLRAPSRKWSALQPLLVHEGAAELLALAEARARAGLADPADAAYCRQRMASLASEMDPSPLLTGDDLMAHGLKSGPAFRQLLHRVREAQLDGEVRTRSEALRLVDALIRMPDQR